MTSVASIVKSFRPRAGAVSLVVLEVAIGFTIVVHALVFGAILRVPARVSVGHATSDVLIARASPGDYGADAATLRALPGVRAVASIDVAPLSMQGFPQVARGDRDAACWIVHASPTIDAALGLSIVRGAALSFDAPGALVTKPLAD